MSSNVYDPAEDPLSEFLGGGELTAPDAIRRHDAAADHFRCDFSRWLTIEPTGQADAPYSR
jgi:hypothetical protein